MGVDPDVKLEQVDMNMSQIHHIHVAALVMSKHKRFIMETSWV